MSEQTQSAAPAQPTTLTIAQAAQRYAESKAQAANPVSDAARTLGQRAAQARQERTTEAAAQSQEPDEGEQQSENDPEGTLGTTDDTASPNDSEADAQGEPAPQTIDLGDGVTVTLDEVREGFMLKADHTRKTQEISERQKALDARESQKLAQLDDVVQRLRQQVGQPKEIDVLVEEFGAELGLKKFAAQSRQIRDIQHAESLKQETEARALVHSLVQRDKQLAETYNKAWSDPAKRDADYTKLTAWALNEGYSPEEVRALTQPHYVRTIDKAAKYDALMAAKSKVTAATTGKPSVVRPGAKVSAQSSQHNSIAQAQQRLKTSGSIADAVALLRARRGG